MSTDPTHAVIAAMVQAHLAHSEQHRAMADAQLEFIDVIRTAFSEVTGLLENLEEEVEVLREVVRTGVGQDGRGRKRRRMTGSPAFVSHTPERDYGPGHGASIPSLSTSPSPTSRLVSLPTHSTNSATRSFSTLPARTTMAPSRTKAAAPADPSAPPPRRSARTSTTAAAAGAGAIKTAAVDAVEAAKPVVAKAVEAAKGVVGEVEKLTSEPVKEYEDEIEVKEAEAYGVGELVEDVKLVDGK